MLMSSLIKRIRDFPLRITLFILIAICLGYIINGVLPYNELGIKPRQFSLSNVYGILMSWTMHGNFNHILNNMVSLIPLLLVFMFSESKKALSIICQLIIISGIFVWLFGGDNTIHVGASGLIFALMGFIGASSILRMKWWYCLFIFISGSSLFYSIRHGLIPTEGISFTAHFGGFLGGIYIALYHCQKEFKNNWFTKFNRTIINGVKGGISLVIGRK